MEYNKIMGTLEIASQQAGYSAEQTAQSYSQLYAILGDQQSSATALQNLQALGLSQQDLCPGNYLFGKYGEIAERVNVRLKGEDDDMDINKLLSKMTNEQAYELVKKAEIHAETLPDDGWSEKEGWFKKAVENGISDGSAPVRHMKRNEVMAILGRLGLLK